MRKIATLGLLASALVVGAALNASKNVEPAEAQDARIIVNFDAYDKSLSNEQVVAYQNYGLSIIRENVTANFKIVARYTNLLNAVVLNIPSSQVNAVRNLNIVKNVDYDTLHHVETREEGSLVIRKANSSEVEENISASTMNVPANTKKGEGTLVGILDSGFLLNHTVDGKVYTHETFSELPSDVSTKLSKTTVDGLKGLNAKTSKEVKSLYFNNKVPFFYDYGGSVNKYDDYAKGKVTSDNDVYSDLSDHGLHVASMAAGNGPTYKGIASNAQLALLKVFTEFHPEGEEKKTYAASTGCFDSAVIAALEDASKIGCDVLNMSFGSDLNDFGENTTVFNLLQELRDQGIWSNYAAGNSGKGFFHGTAYEGWTSEMIETGILSGSANLDAVMTVAASQADREFYNTAIQVNGLNVPYTDEIISDKKTTYDPERPLYGLTNEGTKVEFDWVKVPNFGKAEDYEGLDVNGKIAFVSRGDNTFEDKLKNATEKGAIALAIVNNSTDTVKMSFGNIKNPEIPVILIAYEDRAKFETAGKLTVIKDTYAQNPTAGQMASFTSDGATYDLRIKPEIAAPGHLVKGAVSEDDKGNLDPTATSSYDYWSGTSMATPNYTGAVALLLGEHLDDPSYASTVNARAMSTANIAQDSKGLAASVRIQGAGYVNVANALESKIYLEQDAGNGKAKIELKNNEDIKKGDIKLKFYATSDYSTDQTFKAYIDIYRPNVYTYEKGDLEIDAVKDVKLQGIDNVLLRTVEKTVVIPGGTNEIDLGTISLTDKEKKDIEDYFDYACPIEGFVRLEKEDATNLSIPFLGYYGDVSEAEPVEPFNFEKEKGKVYPSALSNDIAKLVSFPNADLSSDIVIGNFKHEVWADHSEDEEYESPLSNWFSNKGSLYTIPGSDGYSCYQIGNKKDSLGKPTLYASQGYKEDADGSKSGNTMIIQQYVTRSVKDNTLKILKKSDGSVVLSDHMFDTFWGDSGEEEGSEPNYTLAKSHLLSDYLDNGYLCHRAYSIVPLWNDKSEEKTAYPEGEYVLEFTYTTTDDVVHTKTYDFVITNAKPRVTSIADLGNFYRLRFDNDAGAATVSVTGESSKVYNAEVDEKGYYADIAKSLLKKDKMFVSTSSLARITSQTIIKVSGDDIFAVSSSEFGVNHDIKVEKSTSGDTSTYSFTFTKNNSKTTLNNPINVIIATPGGYDSNDVSVKDINSAGAKSAVTLEVTDYSVGFESAVGHFEYKLGSKSHSIVEIGANLSKDTYIKGESFDPTALSVYGIYDNGVTETITEGISYEGFDSSSIGEKVLTVKVGDKTTTVSYKVVNPPALVSIEATVSKKTYEIGEEFLASSLKVIGTFEDGSTKDVTSEATVSGFDSSVAGKITLTVTVGDKTTTVEIKIVAPVPPEPEPSKGCGGEIATTSIVISSLALVGVALLLLKKKKED